MVPSNRFATALNLDSNERPNNSIGQVNGELANDRRVFVQKLGEHGGNQGMRRKKKRNQASKTT